MTARAVILFFLAVLTNAFIVNSLRDIPALAAFAATLGGTLAGALGFPVLARIQAAAKLYGSRHKPIAPNPGHPMLKEVWAQSQRMHCDLTRDGRNIRKDAWLQLHGRLCVAVLPEHPEPVDAIYDAFIDHLETFPEVEIDNRLGREIRRLLALRWDPNGILDTIRHKARGTVYFNDINKMSKIIKNS